MTLKDLKFFGKKYLWLEVKNPDQEFEIYNPFEVKLRSAFFDHDKHSMLKTIDEESLGYDNVFTNGKGSVRELDAALRKKYGIRDFESDPNVIGYFLVYSVLQTSNGGFTSRLINHTRSIDNPLQLFRINNNSRIFVEYVEHPILDSERETNNAKVKTKLEAREANEDTYEGVSNWAKVIENTNYICPIKFNYPLTNP